MCADLIRGDFHATADSQQLLERPRLIELIDKPYQRSITTIVAGAGFGKTTLAQQWSRQAAMPVHWFSLNASDNDPVRLQHRLLRPLWSQTEWRPDTEDDSFETQLESALEAFASSGDRVGIILEDYHHLTNPECHELINMLLTQLPGGMYVLMLSRRRIPLRFGRLRSNGRVQEIDANHLRFTKSEVSGVIELEDQIELDEGQMQRLGMATDGWIVGIKLASLSLRHDAELASINAVQRSKQDQYLDDYVHEEIITALPPNLRELALATADLPYLSTELFNAVLERSDGAQVLAELDRELDVLNPVADIPGRYSYFRIVRRSMLRIAMSQGIVRSMESRRRAVRLLLESGDLADAAELALGSQDWPWIAEVLTPLCRKLADQSDLETLASWLNRTSPHSIAADPQLEYWAIIARLARGRTVGIRERLDEVEPRWMLTGDPLLAGRAALCHGLLDYFGDDESSTDTRLVHALQLMPHEAVPERLYAATFLGKAAFRRGDYEDAARKLGEAESYAAKLPIDEQWAWSVIASDRGNAYALRGDLSSAITKYRLMLAELPAALMKLEGFLRCRIVSLAIERNDLEAAAEELVAIDLLIGDESRDWHHDAAIARTRYLLSSGQRDMAEQWAASYLKRVRRLPEKNQLVLLLARIWLERGEFSLVRSWLADVDSLESDWIQTFGDINFRTLAIDFDLAQGNFKQAAQQAQRLAEEAASTRRRSEFLLFSTRLAIAQHQLGHLERANESLRPAAEIGASGGFVRAFAVTGFDTAMMFDELWSESRGLLGVKTQLHRLFDPMGDRNANLLTKREIEVIQYVSMGRSNQHIADTMFLSVNTVRNHLVNISRRLGASSRSEAVARARQIGILD
jgi:LuxR family maltose regulon positive regulatory protein